jgi:tetratricopeptide (TPR) repeat protein
MHPFPDLEKLLVTAGSAASRLSALNELAFALASLGDAERALPLAREAEQLAIASGDDHALSRALGSLGLSHCLSSRYSEGLQDCLRALVAGERAGDAAAIASALVSAALCQYQMGAREAALESLYRAIEVTEGISCDPILIRAHNALAVILADKGCFDESEAHYDYALEIGAASGDAAYAARIKMNYAGLFRQRGLAVERADENADATPLYRAGVRLCEEALAASMTASAFAEAHCLCMLAELYRELGEKDKAAALFLRMHEQATKARNPHQQSEALVNLGKLRAHAGDSAGARRDFETALGLASAATVRPLVVEALLALSSLHEDCGEFKIALDYRKRFDALQDEMLRVERRAIGVAHEMWRNYQRLRSEAGIRQGA